MKIFVKSAIVVLSLALITGCTKKPAAGDTAENESNTENVSNAANNIGLYKDYITLGDYKGIVIDPIEVTDVEIQSEIDYMLTEYTTAEQVTDRAVADGDTVNMDYEGLRDGVAFEGGTAQGASLAIGSGQFIPGFEESLVGVTPLELVEIPLTFPEDYPEESLAGAKVVFRVTVNYIEGEDIIPEFNDEFIAEMTGGELTSVTEYKDWLKEEMANQAVNERRSKLIAAILESSEIKGYPTDRLDAQVKEINDYYESYATNNGMTVEQLATYYGQTLEAFQEQLQEVGKESVAQIMALSTIAELENITISEEEGEQRAADYGYPGMAEFIERFGDARVQEILLMDKVLDILLSE